MTGSRFLGRFTSFRHVGVFPEQAAHWEWLKGRSQRRGRPAKILNLFGYTGIASLIAAKAGAEVTHIDASKKAIGWARENQALAGLDALPIRWICEDARNSSSARCGAATAMTASSSTRRNSAAGRRARSGTSSPTCPG